MRVFCYVLSLLLFTPLLSAEEVTAHYALIAPKEMDDRVVNRVEKWMTSNLHYAVKVERPEAWKIGEAPAQLDEVIQEQPEDRIATVVLTPTLLPAEQHAFVDPKRRAGIIHVDLLVPTVEEKTLRRLDRQAMRVVGFALGLPPQPIPFCCLYPYRSLEELDAIGRGFSPPAQALYRKQLVEKGIPLTKAARERLPNVNVKMPKPPPAVKTPTE